LELGEAKLQQVEASWQSFKQRGWAVHFIDFTSFYLRLKIGAGRAVKAQTASYGFDEQQAPTPIKMKSSKLRLKKRAPIRESRCALEQATDERASAKAVALTRIRFLAAFDCCI
jgi:hypothetical protein